MTTMDKAAIGWSIAIVAAGVAFAMYGLGLEDQTFAPTTRPATPAVPEPDVTRTDPFADLAADVIRENEMSGDAEAPQVDAVTRQETTSPVRPDVYLGDDTDSQMTTGSNTITVSLPAGTAALGCEETDECYVPARISIMTGDTVIWSNDDTAVHTVTSGTPNDGPSGTFESGLFLSGDTFELTFKDSGTYEYFCIVHPWMTGTVEVD